MTREEACDGTEFERQYNAEHFDRITIQMPRPTPARGGMYYKSTGAMAVRRLYLFATNILGGAGPAEVARVLSNLDLHYPG